MHIQATIVLSVTVAVLSSAVSAGSTESTIRALSQQEAVELAETHIRQNGYTAAPESDVKAQLDLESIEFSSKRAVLLKSRRNTLKPKAIGIKPTPTGWGVAFDYVAHPENCRVVTMRRNGNAIRVEHQDGIRNYWIGFGAK